MSDASATTTSNDGILVGAVQKNARDEIRVRLTEYKGVELVDLRLFYEREDSQEKRPTGKGFAIRRELLPDLIRVLREAEALCVIDSDGEEGGPA